MGLGFSVDVPARDVGIFFAQPELARNPQDGRKISKAFLCEFLGKVNESRITLPNPGC